MKCQKNLTTRDSKRPNLILTGTAPQQSKQVRLCQNHQKILKHARGCVQLNYQLGVYYR